MAELLHNLTSIVQVQKDDTETVSDSQVPAVSTTSRDVCQLARAVNRFVDQSRGSQAENVSFHYFFPPKGPEIKSFLSGCDQAIP